MPLSSSGVMKVIHYGALRLVSVLMESGIRELLIVKVNYILYFVTFLFDIILKELRHGLCIFIFLALFIFLA